MLLKWRPHLLHRSFTSIPAIFEKHGNVGKILLNRPDALNAYNDSMVELIISQLYAFEKDDEIKLVLIEAAGNRAFCAGGDIVHLGDIHRENQMHHKIKMLKKPVVSIGDRIVMGGGMGLCCNSKYRMGTERSVFAMPETRIGYYPDAGATFFLSRLGDLGMYLALTGHRIQGFDAVYTDFVTHYVNSENLSLLKIDILGCSSEDDLMGCLLKYENPNNYEEFSLTKNLLDISKCFSGSSMLEIKDRLVETNNEFSKSTLATLALMSPLALCITHKTQLLSRSLSFTECLRMECGISDRTYALGEFKEGVRALLIEKDLLPQWNPPTLEQVDHAVVEYCFSDGKHQWQPLP